MKIQKSGSQGNHQFFIICGLAALVVFLLPGKGIAQDVTITNDGSYAIVDLGSSAGMDNWSVGVQGQMQNQLNQQWFWYSVNGAAVQSIDSIGGLNYQLSADGSTLDATYQNAQLAVAIQYQLQGGGVNSGSADMSESITVVNNMLSNFNINFFQYSYFNLLQSGNNVISINGSPGSYQFVSQNTVGNGNGIVEVIDQPNANFAEAGAPGTNAPGEVLYDVESGNNLNDNSSAGPGNVAWSFEWSTNVAPGLDNALNIYKDKNLAIQPVPEPSIIAFVASGLAGCGLALRRRRS